MSMVTGARQVLTETFDPDESVRLVETERATILHGFDTHFKDLLDALRRHPRDVSSIRCRGKIASFKTPRHVLFVEDFPWTSSGKIQKVKLREEALRRLGAA